jgi:hypothetical protein
VAAPPPSGQSARTVSPWSYGAARTAESLVGAAAVPVDATLSAPQSTPAARAATPAPPHTPQDPPHTPSPWDEVSGPGVAVDLDATPQRPSLLESVLAAPRAPVPMPLPSTLTPSQPIVGVGASEPPSAPEPDESDALMEGARELFELGDFSGSLELVEKVLRANPQNEGALAYFARNEATLLKMYESKLGDLMAQPHQLVLFDEVIWMNMHHRAGFILAQVDGHVSYEDILAISGMPRFETVRILADLVSSGIIGV